MRPRNKLDLALTCRHADSICEDCACKAGACHDMMRDIFAIWTKQLCDVCGEMKMATNGQNFYWPLVEKKDMIDL